MHHQKPITLDDIEKYCDMHPNVEEYKNELELLIKNGRANHLTKKNNEKIENDRINSLVYQKIYKKKNSN